MPRLQPRQETQINNASRKAIVAALKSAKKNFASNRWLGSNNRYKRDTVKNISKDLRRNTLNKKHLAEYIAVSSFLHCVDGWLFLGKALSSQGRGDVDCATHLAYYAELRAAMALLATEGIAIFNRDHFVVTGPKVCVRLYPWRYRRSSGWKNAKKGTHDVAWSVLEYWAGTGKSRDLLMKVIKPRGLFLEKWLTAFITTPVFLSTLGGEWFKTWGLDLKRLSEDRRARNESSYRPTRLIKRDLLSVRKRLGSLIKIWGVFQPETYSRFEYLDRHLLRLVLEAAFKSDRNVTFKQAPRLFRDRIRRTLADPNIRGFIDTYTPLSAFEQLYNFLIRVSEGIDAFVINEAKGEKKAHERGHHIQVIARAALFLRVATGACAELIDKAEIDSSNVKFWWSFLGQDTGLWGSDDEFEDFSGLWGDIEIALAELNAFNDVATPVPSTPYELWYSNAAALAVLASCERIPLWGFDL